MTFNIEEFRSKVNDGQGLMPNNRFIVRFTAPSVLIGETDKAGTQEFFCEGVNFPGFMLATYDVRRYTYGPVEKRPFGPNFTQLQCTFMNDNESRPWKYFHDWTSKIMNHDMRNGINGVSTTRNPYTVLYKNDYSVDVHIYVFDQSGKDRITIVLREAFPSQLVDSQLGWANQNEIFRFQVAFEFVDWYIEKLQ